MSKQEQRFLKRFFDFLNEEHVDYAVIRNYESLPETVPGTDIDLVIAEKDFRRIAPKLDELAASVDYRVWKKFPKPWFLTHVKFSPLAAEEAQDIVKIDFMRDGVRWLGWPILPMDELMKRRFVHNGVQVLDEPYSVLVTILNKLLSNGLLKARYTRQYWALDENARKYVKQCLSDLFGQYSKKLVRQLECDTESFNSRAIKWLFLYRKRFAPYQILQGFLYVTFVSTLQRVLAPPGEFVVVIGPDGTGKSSLVDKVEAKCVRMYKRICRFHHYPYLRIFSKLDKKSAVRYKKRINENDEWTFRQRKFSAIASLLRCGYQSVRYLTGYWLWIWPERVKGSLVLGERWCYDLLLDPKSKGINLPYWVRRLVFSICPKPDKVIIVRCDPEVAAQRKGELPVGEIQRQMELIDHFFSSLKKAWVIDNGGSLDEGFKNMLHALLKVSESN